MASGSCNSCTISMCSMFSISFNWTIFLLGAYENDCHWLSPKKKHHAYPVVIKHGNGKSPICRWFSHENTPFIADAICDRVAILRPKSVLLSSSCENGSGTTRHFHFLRERGMNGGASSIEREYPTIPTSYWEYVNIHAMNNGNIGISHFFSLGITYITGIRYLEKSIIYL